ncbi:hypothetical protein [Ramlibacter sp.]|uniref:hypothetical protein n=1 Tax=Ramlibacter sp. TaxID=1917967 RepID=UPI003D0BA59E
MSDTLPAARGIVNVAEINPYAPRPFTFTEAAVCLRDAIRAAGYDSEIHVNRADTSQRCIVLGALPPHLPAVEQLDAKRAAIYNLEQLASDSPLVRDQYKPWLRNWLVADYHQANLEVLARESGGAQRALELPLVPGPGVAWRPDLPHEPVVDVLFFGTASPRRDALLDRVRAAGMTVEVVAGAFGEELAPALKRARLVLHVHFYETGLFPIARFLQPVAQGLPIVCEDSVFSTLSDWSASGIVFAPYDGLVDACASLIRSGEERAERARRNREFAAAIDFRTPFERLLRTLEGTPDAAELTNFEIEAMLAQDATELPPEAHLPPPPLKMVERTPGQGRYGVLIVVLLLLFSIWTIWRATG